MMNFSPTEDAAVKTADNGEDQYESPSPVTETISEEPASYHAIIEAAITQFAQKGFDGTRIETVAREAKYNKALVYRHFGTKEGLFRAALKHKLDERLKLITQPGDALSDVLSHWFMETRDDPDYVRLIVGEALFRDAAGVVDDDWRHEYYKKHVALTELAQEQGELPKSIEPGFLVVIFAAIFFFPVVLPQIARMISGYSPDSPEFQKHLRKALVVLENILRESVTADEEKSDDGPSA